MQWDLKKRLIILGVVVLGAFLLLVPTINISYKSLKGLEVTPQERLGENWISKPIALGLDLSGGVQLIYRVEVEEAVLGKLQAKATAIRSFLRDEKVAVRRAVATKDKRVEITLMSDRALEKAKAKIAENDPTLTFVDERRDGTSIILSYKISEREEFRIRTDAVDQAVENLRVRVDRFGVAEPLIQKVNADRILLQMPGVKDIESVKKIVGRVAKLEFRFLPKNATDPTVTMKDKEGNPIAVEEDVQMSGDMVGGASIDFGEYGEVIVSLEMTPEGARTFARVSSSGIGRELAIILDGVVVSHPVIKDRITQGRASITGQFSMQEARELALVLKAGALPAPLTIMEEQLVGPTLGRESIEDGTIAIIVGFLAIFIFMVVYYRKSGLIAAATLGLNLIFICALLSLFGATLTLPGIAGLALTIGMAVDANVIIFERIRDEIKNNATRNVAVAAGFDKALSAIVDSNLTTLVTAILLYYFGTGPVRGFAVTLGIGVITTMFCATFVARIFFDALPLKAKDSVLSI